MMHCVKFDQFIGGTMTGIERQGGAPVSSIRKIHEDGSDSLSMQFTGSIRQSPTLYTAEPLA